MRIRLYYLPMAKILFLHNTCRCGAQQKVRVMTVGDSALFRMLVLRGLHHLGNKGPLLPHLSFTSELFIELMKC